MIGIHHLLGILLFKFRSGQALPSFFPVNVTCPVFFFCRTDNHSSKDPGFLYASFCLPFLVLFHGRGTFGFWFVDKEVAYWQKPLCTRLLFQELIMENLLIFVKAQDWELQFCKSVQLYTTKEWGTYLLILSPPTGMFSSFLSAY